MYKGELFNYRYDEIFAAIEATPGVSNMELARAFCLSYNIIRALTATMEKEGDITGRVERSGLHSKTLWFANENKKCLQKPNGFMSIAVGSAIESPTTRPVRVRVIEETPAATHTVRVRLTEEALPATYPVRVRVVAQEAQPATFPVRVQVTEGTLPATRRVPFPEVEEYSLPTKHSTEPSETR